jgi:hypothetical protein
LAEGEQEKEKARDRKDAQGSAGSAGSPPRVRGVVLFVVQVSLTD